MTARRALWPKGRENNINGNSPSNTLSGMNPVPGSPTEWTCIDRQTQKSMNKFSTNWFFSTANKSLILCGGNECLRWKTAFLHLKSRGNSIWKLSLKAIRKYTSTLSVSQCIWPPHHFNGNKSSTILRLVRSQYSPTLAVLQSKQTKRVHCIGLLSNNPRN